MASACKFFEEDAVYKLNKKKFVEIGLVLENSEFITSEDEQSDEENYADWERMKKGHIRVAWHPKGIEEVLLERKVKLFDRSLMPGDVVRKVIKGKDTQLGYCRTTTVKSDVQIVSTKQVVVDVDSRDLIPLEEYSSDIAVFKDSWVGIVKNVKTELTLRFQDGSRCTMPDVDAYDLEDVFDRRDKASEYRKYTFYPGQQLWGPTYCFEKVKWLTLNQTTEQSLTNASKNVRTTVEDVKVTTLGVQWLCKAYCEEITHGSESEQPKYIVTGEELSSIKMLNIFEPCTLQIGDRNYLTFKDSYKIMTLEEWRNHITILLNGASEGSPIKAKINPQPMSENKENIEEDLVCNGYNEADDDSDFEDIEDEEDGVSSDTGSATSHSTASSIDKSKGKKKKAKKGPVLATKMMKKKRNGRKRKPTSKDTQQLIPGNKLVTETILTQTKANVVWQDGTVEQDIPSSSLYPVHHLDGHEFFPGDYVIDNKETRTHEYGVVKQVDHNGRTALITWMRTYHAGADPHPEVVAEQEVSVYDIKDHPDFKYRPGSCVIRVANFEDPNPESTAGQVVDVHPSGKVEVSWVNGNASLCYPQELYRIGEYDSDDLWADDDSFGDEDDSWETESENSLIGAEDTNNYFWNEAENQKMESMNILIGAENVLTEKEIEGSAKVLEKLNFKLDENEEKSTEDMQEKLLANIEKLRAGMARLEEVFTQNPTLQTCNVMRRLLELYKHCKVLDQLLGTTYFHERHLQSLVERLKHRGRVNSIQHMADQIFRLFSSAEANAEATENSSKSAKDEPNVDGDRDNAEVDSSRVEIDILIESPPCTPSVNNIETSNNEEVSIKKSTLLSPVSPTPGSGSEPRNICQQLCAILKSRLLKAHEDAEMRFSMSHNTVSAMMAQEIEGSPKKNAREVSSQTEITEQTIVNMENAIKARVLKEDDTSEKESNNAEAEKEINATGKAGLFSVLASVPDSHKYKLSIFQPSNPCAFFRVVRKEMNILKTSLPEGIIVKSFEDRIDLFSVMIIGPKRTPYEDGLFFFDFQFPPEYPKAPPLCHYISYCSDRLNPNLYEGGKVCVSLLGTWGGKGTEIWHPDSSNLLQVIVSIQGLILVSEPYFNEAGFERQKGTQQGRENSRMYNEMVVLKLVQAMTSVYLNPPEVFKQEIRDHFKTEASKLVERLENWLTRSEEWNSQHPMTPVSPTVFKDICDSSGDDSSAQAAPLPEFPLLPASKGFCLTLRKSLAEFKEVVMPPESNQS